jgi:CRP/FNR family transcriptional regulator, cyclic AMP receptor protein
MDQQFTRGSPASSPRTNAAIRRRGSTRPNRPPSRSISSSNSCRQPSRSTLSPAAIARFSVVHTPPDHRAVAASRPPPSSSAIMKCRWSIRRRSYRRDEVIVHQGDPADTLHLIAAGHVSVRVTLPGGEFVVVAILGPGEAFGEIALVGSPHARSATVIALEQCETLSLGRGEFHRLRTSYPGVDRFLIELLSARVEGLNNYLLEALYVPAERRVLRRLLHLCELYTGDDQHIVIPVTQEMLASLAGTTRPTANQVLCRPVASHIVSISRSQIVVLDRQSLRQRAG